MSKYNFVSILLPATCNGFPSTFATTGYIKKKKQGKSSYNTNITIYSTYSSKFSGIDDGSVVLATPSGLPVLIMSNRSTFCIVTLTRSFNIFLMSSSCEIRLLIFSFVNPAEKSLLVPPSGICSLFGWNLIFFFLLCTIGGWTPPISGCLGCGMGCNGWSGWMFCIGSICLLTKDGWLPPHSFPQVKEQHIFGKGHSGCLGGGGGGGGS